MIIELRTPFAMMTGDYPTAALATAEWGHRSSGERWLCWRAERRLLGKVRAIRSGVRLTVVRRNKIALDFELTGASLKDGQRRLIEFVESCQFDPPLAVRLDRALPDRLVYQPLDATLGPSPSLLVYRLMEDLTKAIEVHRHLIRVPDAASKVSERLIELCNASMSVIDQPPLHPATARVGCLAAWARSQATTQPQAFPSAVQFWKYVAVKARFNPAWRN